MDQYKIKNDTQASNILSELNSIKQVIEKGIPETERQIDEFNRATKKISLLSEKIAGKLCCVKHHFMVQAAVVNGEYCDVYKSPLSKDIQTEVNVLYHLIDDFIPVVNNAYSKIHLMDVRSWLSRIDTHISSHQSAQNISF